MSDFAQAIRALRKSPGFSLVAIWTKNPQLTLNAPAISWPRYEEIRDGARSFSSVGISAGDNFTLTGNGDPEQLNGLRVSASFLPTLGIRPAGGRNFTADEDVPNGPFVCILGHELWQTRFGGRPIVGQTITLSGQSWQIVGIMPPRLTAPFGQVQVFTPRVYDATYMTPAQVQAGVGYTQPIARLRPGVTLEQAREELAAIQRASHDRFPTRLDANNAIDPRLFVDALVGNLEPTFNALLGAVAFVLLIACANAAALFLGAATAFVGVPVARYRTPERQARFFDEVIARLTAQPGVTDAAAAIGIPLGGFNPRSPYAVGGRPIPPLPQRSIANLGIVSDGYFRLMRIPFVAGRPFDTRDRSGTPIVCIVNESFAKRLLPGESPLGQVMLRGRDAQIRAEIVGVIRDVKTNGLNNPVPDEIYYPMRQLGGAGMGVLARTDGDPERLQAAIRAAVRAVDPDQPISFFATLESNVANSLGVQRIVASLTVVFAAIALVLSAVGLYSVVAYAVSQRTAEIGIRMALGAQRAQVISLVMRGGLQLVAVGLAVGLIAAAGAARLIRTLLFGVRPLDPAIYAGVTGLFTAIAAVACLLPSLRAARIDPLHALRTE